MLILNFAQSIVNGSLDIKIKKIKLDMWHKIRQQLHINLDSNWYLRLKAQICAKTQKFVQAPN